MKRILAMLICLVLALSAMTCIAEGGTYGEAPMLAQKVSEGTLPPVEERLPAETPRCLTPLRMSI